MARPLGNLLPPRLLHDANAAGFIHISDYMEKLGLPKRWAHNFWAERHDTLVPYTNLAWHTLSITLDELTASIESGDLGVLLENKNVSPDECDLSANKIRKLVKANTSCALYRYKRYAAILGWSMDELAETVLRKAGLNLA